MFRRLFLSPCAVSDYLISFNTFAARAIRDRNRGVFLSELSPYSSLPMHVRGGAGSAFAAFHTFKYGTLTEVSNIHFGFVTWPVVEIHGPVLTGTDHVFVVPPTSYDT